MGWNSLHSGPPFLRFAPVITTSGGETKRKTSFRREPAHPPNRSAPATSRCCTDRIEAGPDAVPVFVSGRPEADEFPMFARAKWRMHAAALVELFARTAPVHREVKADVGSNASPYLGDVKRRLFERPSFHPEVIAGDRRGQAAVEPMVNVPSWDSVVAVRRSMSCGGSALAPTGSSLNNSAFVKERFISRALRPGRLFPAASGQPFPRSWALVDAWKGTRRRRNLRAKAERPNARLNRATVAGRS